VESATRLLDPMASLLPAVNFPDSRRGVSGVNGVRARVICVTECSIRSSRRADGGHHRLQAAARERGGRGGQSQREGQTGAPLQDAKMAIRFAASWEEARDQAREIECADPPDQTRAARIRALGRDVGRSGEPGPLVPERVRELVSSSRDKSLNSRT